MEKNIEFRPKVSIVIPVYNGSNYMREAIDSALAQTYDNIEIIVVNDGSTDNTEEIAKSYGDKIRYFAKENGGTTTALNVGIKKMEGNYFSWLSHDDMYYPNKIARQIEELGKLEDKNTIMMSDLDGINEKYEKIYQTNYISHLDEYPPRSKSNIHPVIYNQTHGCTLLIPKVCFDKVGLFDEKQLVAQDFEFFYRAFLKFPHKLIPEVLVTARDSSNRQGIRSKARGDIEYSALFISIIENLTDKDIELLAPDKARFYNDMRGFFRCARYSIALEFIEKKIINNLQISSLDLIGNKFNGFDLHLDLRKNGIDSKHLVFIKESDDVNTYRYNFDTKDATKELLQKEIFLDADIVHMHLIHNIIDLNYLPIISKLKPTILSLHDPFFLGGHCVHHFDCKKWQTQCMDCSYLNEPFALEKDISALNFKLKEQAIQNSQITAIVASQWMKNKVQQSPIWQGKKIYLLPLGVNQELFKSVSSESAKKKFEIPKESIAIMFRSDTGSFKGLDILKQTLSCLKNQETITLITVGETGRLEEFKNKFNVIEYGWIKDDELLASLYQACDIFLMPSRQETFGMMAVEAMSCGKMVLALESEGSALPEVIYSPVCGLAVTIDNFARELQRLIDDPNEIVERGKKSLEYAQKKYSKDVYVKETMKIYSEVMAEHKITKEYELLLNQLKKYASINLVADIQEKAGKKEKKPHFFKKMERKFRRNILYPAKKKCLAFAIKLGSL